MSFFKLNRDGKPISIKIDKIELKVWVSEATDETAKTNDTENEKPAYGYVVKHPEKSGD